MVIQFDVDGCLADFIAGYNALAYRIDRPEVAKPEGPDSRWGDYNDAVVWQAIEESKSFYFELASIPELRQNTSLWLRIAKLVHEQDVYFVTSRRGIHAKQQTEAWLNVRGIYTPTVIVSKCKADVAEATKCNFSIEDKVENSLFLSYVKGNKSYILDKPYNQWDHVMHGRKVIRVPTLEAYLDAVESKTRQA